MTFSFRNTRTLVVGVLSLTLLVGRHQWSRFPWPTAPPPGALECRPDHLPELAPPEHRVVHPSSPEAAPFDPPPSQGLHGPRGLRDTPPAAARPTREEAQRIVHALDGLALAFCRGYERDFAGRLSRWYRGGHRHLLDSLHRAHERYRNFDISYQIQDIRAYGRIVQVTIRWDLRYNERNSGVQVTTGGTTRVGLDRRDGLRLVDQRGTVLFAGF